MFSVNMIKAILFDRDGVIVDSEAIHIRSIDEAFKRQGVKINKEDKKFVVGRNNRLHIAHFRKIYSFNEEKWAEDEVKLYHKYFDNVKIFDPCVRFIKKVKKIGFKTALVTSGGINSTNKMFKRTGLDKYFDAVITHEQCKEVKPHPMPYLIAAKELKVLPSECVVIEDSEVGVTAAVNAGMKCIVIKNKFTKHHDFSKASLVVDSADEIDVDSLKKMQ